MTDQPKPYFARRAGTFLQSNVLSALWIGISDEPPNRTLVSGALPDAEYVQLPANKLRMEDAPDDTGDKLLFFDGEIVVGSDNRGPASRAWLFFKLHDDFGYAAVIGDYRFPSSALIYGPVRLRFDKSVPLIRAPAPADE